MAVTAKEKREHDAQSRVLLKRHFEDRWSPSHWAQSAENLHHAAGILFSVYDASRTEDGEPSDFEGAEMDRPASLLYSYAMENAIKGYLIKTRNLKAGDFEGTPVPKVGEIFAKKWKAHDIAYLCGEAGTITGSGNEELFLNVLTSHVIWAGKYPTAFHYDGPGGFVLPKQFCSADNMPPGSVDCSMRYVLDPVFRKLVSGIW